MTVVLTQGYRQTYGNQYYYEDTRPGHNIGYLSDGRMPINSVTFTPIFGPEPNDHKTTAGALNSYWGSQYSPEFQTTSNGTMCFGGWLRLGNKYCPTVTVLTTGATGPTSDWFGNVLPYNWISCVHDEQPIWMMVGDDDGADKYVHTQNSFYGLGQGYYASYASHILNDGDELWSKLPNYSTNSTGASGLGGGFMHSYKSTGSASYRGFHELTVSNSASAQYMQWQPLINFHRNGSSTLNRFSGWGTYRNASYLGTYGGLPYYLEISLGQYEGSSGGNVHVSAYSYDVDTNTATEVFNGDATYTDTVSSSFDDGGYTRDHNSNSGDAYSKGPSKWMLAQGGAYRYLMFPTFSSQDYPTHNMIGMDTSSFAISYRGGANSTSQPYMYAYQDDYLGQTDFLNRGMNPVDDTLGGNVATSSQPGLAAMQFDWHGIVDVNNGELYGPDYTGAACSEGNGICNQMHSLFPSYGTQGKAEDYPEHRRIYTWQWHGAPTNWTSGYSNDKLYWRGFTTVPETPHNWVWLDEKHTLIAAICSNNTYIYECRGHTVHSQLDKVGNSNYAKYVYYIGNTSSSGADAGNFTSIGGYSNRFTVPGFNGNPSASQYAGSFMGWVHVNTIPHRVVSMGIDKHGKIFALTANITALGGTNGYGGNLHMWTMNTPFSVALAGDVTTDTITYSGSNIDKTLTVEAFGIRGRRVKTKVQLEIIGTTAQFDNGTQSKEVTTSTGGTVSETITVTGSSEFNIVASFGV